MIGKFTSGDVSLAFTEEVPCATCGRSAVPAGWCVLDLDHHALADLSGAIPPRCGSCEAQLPLGVLLVRRRPVPALLWARDGGTQEGEVELVTRRVAAAGDAGFTQKSTFHVVSIEAAAFIARRDIKADLLSPPSDGPDDYWMHLGDTAQLVLGPLVETFTRAAAASDAAEARRIVERHPELLSEGAIRLLINRAEAYRRPALSADADPIPSAAFVVNQQHAGFCEVAATALYLGRELGLDAIFPTSDPSLAEAAALAQAILNGAQAPAQAAQVCLAKAAERPWPERRNPWRARILLALGVVHARLADKTAATRAIEEAWNVFCGAADRAGTARAMWELGALARDQGSAQEAGAYLEGALSDYETLGHWQGQAHTRVQLAELAEDAMDWDLAKAQLSHALRLFSATGEHRAEADVRRKLGMLAGRCGNHDEAIDQLRAALALLRRVGDRDGQVDVRADLMALAREIDDPEEVLEAAVDGFISQPNWFAARQYLAEHDELLRDAAVSILERRSEFHRRTGSSDDQAAALYDAHARRLTRACEEGVDAAFAETASDEGLIQAVGELSDNVLRQSGDDAEPAMRLSLAVVLELVGNRRRSLEHWRAAIEQYRLVAGRYRALGDRVGEAMVHADLSRLTQKCGQWRVAATHLKRASELFRAIGELAKEAFCRKELALIHSLQLHDEEEALREFRIALELYRKAPDRHGEANVLKELGRLRRQRGDLKTSDEHLGEALTLFRALHDFQGEAEVRYELGVLASVGSGEPAVALDHFANALRLFRRLGDRQGEARAHYAMAEVWQDWDRVDDHLRSALELSRQAGDSHTEGCVLLSMATQLNYREGDWATISAYFSAAVEAFGEAGARRQQADALLDMGRVEQHFLGARARPVDWSSVEERFESALRLYREVDCGRGEAHALLMLGDLALERDDFEAAGERLNAAVALYRRLGDRLGEANARVGCGRVASRTGPRQAAIEHLQAALQLYRQRKNLWGEAQALFHLSEHLVSWAGARSDPERLSSCRLALEFALQAVRVFELVRTSQGSAATRGDVYRHGRRLYLLALRLAAAVGDGRAALEVSEAARAEGVAALLRSGRPQFGSELGELLARIRLLETDGRDGGGGRDEGAIASADVKAAGQAIRQDALEAMYRQLGELTSTSFSAAYAPSSATGDPALARVGLPAGAHALLYELDTADAEAWIAYCTWLPPAGEPRVTQAVLGHGARRMLTRYALCDPRAPYVGDPIVYGQLAEALLPSELRDALTGRTRNDPIELVIVPAGPLWALPWGALRLSDGRVLLEPAAIALAPSLGVQAALAGRESLRGVGGALVCVGSHTNLDPRPELSTLAELFEGDLEQVAPGELIDRLTRGPTRSHLVITAVHGQAPGSTSVGLDQHVDLGGGRRLRAADLLGIALTGDVTLGTCFVGSAITRPGDEPLTLPTVALCVGAESIVGGVFAVPDQSTASVLGRYYRHLADGRPAHQALRCAQLQYLAEHPASPPANWAGLVTTGMPHATSVGAGLADDRRKGADHG